MARALRDHAVIAAEKHIVAVRQARPPFFAGGCALVKRLQIVQHLLQHGVAAQADVSARLVAVVDARLSV